MILFVVLFFAFFFEFSLSNHIDNELVCASGLASAKDALTSVRHLNNEDHLWTLRTSLRRLETLLFIANTVPGFSVSFLLLLKNIRKVTNKIRDSDVSRTVLIDTLCRNNSSLGCSAALSTLQLFSASSRLDFRLRRDLQGALRKLIFIFTDCKKIHASITDARINALNNLQVRITQAFQTFTSGTTTLNLRTSRLHSIRIASRSMRYILELLPFELKNDNLKEVQTLTKELGLVHDLGNLARSLSRMPNQEELTRLAYNMEGASLNRAYESWFSKVTSSLNISSLIDSRLIKLLAHIAVDVIDSMLPHSSSTEKIQSNIGIEIERRWVLSGLPSALFIWQASGSHLFDLPLGTRVLHMIQGYVPGAVISERLRSSAECEGNFGMSGNCCTAWEPEQDDFNMNQSECKCIHHLKRTVKTGVGLVRGESEEKISKDFFSAMWPITRNKRLHKIRFVVPVVGESLYWEIDQVFSGPNKTMVILELELKSEGAKLPPFPNWLKDFVGEEVTNTLTSSSIASEDYVKQSL